MDMTDIGRRLRVAREERGLSQEAAADAIGKPRTAITQIEAGARKVSSLELTKLAAIYHRQINYFIEDERGSALKVFLRADSDLDPETCIQIENCFLLCQEGVELKNLLGRTSRFGPPLYSLPEPGNTGEAVAQGAQVANDERRRLNIGSAPIPDVSELICKQGIWASGTRLPDKISGLFIRDPSIGMAVIVNASHVLGRKRFSYAHEYAHALMDRDNDVTVSSTDNSKIHTETRANAFAASFLMPRSGVDEILRSLDKGVSSRQEDLIFNSASGERIKAEARTSPGTQVIKYKDVATCAHYFGVSYVAALYRLKSLKYISQQETSSLLDQEDFGREYLATLKIDDIDREQDTRFWNRDIRREIAYLAIEAYQRDEISRGRLLELSNRIDIQGEKLFNLAKIN